MDVTPEMEEWINKITEQEGYGNILNRGGVTVGLLRKFAVWLETHAPK